MQTLEEVTAYWDAKVTGCEAFCERMKHLDDPKSVTDPYDMAIMALDRTKKARANALARFARPFKAQEPAAPESETKIIERPVEVEKIVPDPAQAERIRELEEMYAKLKRDNEAIRAERAAEAEPPKGEGEPPEGLRSMLNEGEDLSSLEARVRISELLNVELAELRNLHDMAGEDLPRETEIETYLGVLARWGERPL